MWRRYEEPHRGAGSSGLSLSEVCPVFTLKAGRHLRGYCHEGFLLSLPHLPGEALRDLDLSPVRLARGDGVLPVFSPPRRRKRPFLPSSFSGTGAPALPVVR